MDRSKSVVVAGACTLAGAAIRRKLLERGFANVADDDDVVDWADAWDVHAFFSRVSADVVILAAGASGGIRLNRERPADLMLDNLRTIVNVIDTAFRNGVRRLLLVGSSCMYPRKAPQPMHPSSLLAGAVEPTNDAYALAKLTGWKLCDAYRRQHGVEYSTIIPPNLYGLGDDFSPAAGHVIPALIRRMHEAKVEGADELVIWGSGRPVREFLFAEDFADACMAVLDGPVDDEPINVPGNIVLSISELARVLAHVVGFAGALRFDSTQPDGAPEKRLNGAVLERRGWSPPSDFVETLRATYAWFLEQTASRESIHDRATV